MDTNKIADWIARQDEIDGMAKPIQNWIAGIYSGDSKAIASIERFLHGNWLGHPLHAVFVHIPVGAWTLAAILDLFSAKTGARAAADWAIAVGLLAAIPAIITGATDWYVYGGSTIRRIGFLHMMANVCAVLLYGISFAIRGGNSTFGALFTGYLGFTFLVVSGYLGGTMVYEKRVGVNHAPDTDDGATPDEFITVMSMHDLPLNTPTKVQVGDVFAVLVKTKDRVYALAEKCSHEGGPLSEGQIVNGCIVCPFHASAFRLKDGQVECGPSVYAQPVFEVYIRDDEIRVKPIRAEDPLIASAIISQNVAVM
jgi:nitrite reductase/ring-hydroxylating ferredoxin subunit/uncharacterized membrane protein